MTEDQAKTKLCGPSMAAPVPRNCVGSVCNSWRWIREDTGNNPSVDRKSQTDGFCGPEGKP